MKKKLLLIALLFACTSLISCSENNDDPTPEPESVYPIDFVTFVMTDQSKYADHSFCINVNGKSVTFNLSEMTQANASDFPLFKKKVDFQLADSIAADPKKEYYKVYKYSVGSLKKNQMAYGEKFTYTVKNDRPGTETASFLFAYFFQCTDKTATGRNYNSTEVTEFASSVFNDFERLNAYLKKCSEIYSKESNRPSIKF